MGGEGGPWGRLGVRSRRPIIAHSMPSALGLRGTPCTDQETEAQGRFSDLPGGAMWPEEEERPRVKTQGSPGES